MGEGQLQPGHEFQYSYMLDIRLPQIPGSSAFGGGWEGAHANLLDDFIFDLGHGSGLLTVNIANEIQLLQLAF
jgi:hypothetical protein